MRIAVLLGAVAVAAGAAILLNLTLLGYAEPRNDPVGKLSPRVVLATVSTPAPPPPPVVTRPHHGEHDD